MLQLAFACFAWVCLVVRVSSASSSVLYDPSSRVINGTLAQPGEFPSIVSFQRERKHFCAGTILDATHVLTAAHCTEDQRLKLLYIQYGVRNVRENKNIVKVKKIVAHKDYEHGHGYLNDVAVLILEEPIIFSDTVKPAILPEPFSGTPENASAVLAGWGYTSDNGFGSDLLLRVGINVFTDEECETSNLSAKRDYHLCAGVHGGGKGQCEGDSGGPLYADGIQIGIVSWSRKPCTSPKYPGVFVKVTNFVDWIKKQLV